MIQSRRFMKTQALEKVSRLYFNPSSSLTAKVRQYVTRPTLISETGKNKSENNSVMKTHWQAENNLDIQRVTQSAIIHELTQEQTRTIESVVPWFLNDMPVSLSNERAMKVKIIISSIDLILYFLFFFNSFSQPISVR